MIWILDQPGARPAFDVSFTVSYGLSRDQLEDLDHRIESVGAYEAYRTDVSHSLYLVTVPDV
jgi:hypothetical protein